MRTSYLEASLAESSPLLLFLVPFNHPDAEIIPPLPPPSLRGKYQACAAPTWAPSFLCLSVCLAVQGHSDDAHDALAKSREAFSPKLPHEKKSFNEDSLERELDRTNSECFAENKIL